MHLHRFIHRSGCMAGYGKYMYIYNTVTAGEDGLTTNSHNRESCTANDIMTVSPYPYTPPVNPVPATDGLLGGDHSDWPCPEQLLISDNTYSFKLSQCKWSNNTCIYMYKIVGIIGKKCFD